MRAGCSCYPLLLLNHGLGEGRGDRDMCNFFFGRTGSLQNNLLERLFPGGEIDIDGFGVVDAVITAAAV
jgi:hypothetical protein